MKNLSILALSALIPLSASATNCKVAMEQALRKEIGPTATVEIQTKTITPIGGEGMAEVQELVLDWYPHSDGRSEYYHLVSATCVPGKNSGSLSAPEIMELYNDMPGEGGVQVKTVTKARM